MVKRKIIYQGSSKTGLPILVGYPVVEDVEQLRNFINTISLEQSFILAQGRQYAEEEEKKYLEQLLDQITNRKAIKLIIFTNEEIIGSADIMLQKDAVSHEGVFGIIIAKAYRGQGLGKFLMQLVLAEAKKELADLKIITLGVFGDNPNAENMYKSFGFKEYGRLPKGILHRGRYVDHIYMYKTVSDI